MAARPRARLQTSRPAGRAGADRKAAVGGRRRIVREDGRVLWGQHLVILFLSGPFIRPRSSPLISHSIHRPSSSLLADGTKMTADLPDEILIQPAEERVSFHATGDRTNKTGFAQFCDFQRPIYAQKFQKVYTKGRPPWYSRDGRLAKEPYVIGICGGSASGKTTVARCIIEQLGMPWVTVLSMDSFYNILNEEQRERAARSDYNFDHPDAFDFDLLAETIRRLRSGKSVEVPVYDFSTHSRDKNPKLMYGADVIIFEGILSFFRPEIVELMDLKIFVDTDSDTRLARRMTRDISERGRSLESVMGQYFRFVKPAFDTFIAPAAKVADLIVPRGGSNTVAIELIVRHVKTQLSYRGYDPTQSRPEWEPLQGPIREPDSLHIIEQTPQVLGLHTIIRNRDTPRDQFIFVAERLMQILIENAMEFIPYAEVQVETPSGEMYAGCRRDAKICGIAVMRAGETLERPLRAVVKDCKLGKILIQTNDLTREPELHYLRLPKEVHKYKVFLMDPIVATGAAATMAIRILLDHDVREEDITLLSLLMSETGAHSIAYAFPKVRLLTTAVDQEINALGFILPGMGNFGDRYYGTDAFDHSSSDEEEEEETEETADKLEIDVESVSSDSAINSGANSGADINELKLQPLVAAGRM
ncbi:Uridine kinase [Aphelenchoides fujianensis]|nr:Uridine kinase [Aphelenchoides fujianensis]